MTEILKRLAIGCCYGVGFAVGAALVVAAIFWIGIIRPVSEATDTAMVSSPKEASPPSPDAIERVSVFIDYRSAILLIASKTEAAAFVFEGTGQKEASYKYRHVAKDGKVESSGSGVVFEKYVPTLDRNATEINVLDAGSATVLKAGSLSIEWSVRSANSGWVYYRPHEYKLFVIPSSDFSVINLRSLLK